MFAAHSNNMEAISASSFSSAKSAVELAISLVGIMALWLGLMRVLEAGGCMLAVAKLLQPIMRRLFKDVPTEHPAMSAIIMNISANMLGLGNAATPFGIRAMIELNRLNPIKGTATNAMCLFLAINTSSVALLPLGAIGIRAAAKADAPAAIWAPSFIATLASTIVGISIALLAAKIYGNPTSENSSSALENSEPNSIAKTELPSYQHLLGRTSIIRKTFCWLAFTFCILMCIQQILTAEDSLSFIQTQVLAHWLMPMLMLSIVLYGCGAGVHVYEAVTEGAKQGFEVAIRIIPFLVTILVAIGVFRASGGLELFTSIIAPITNLIGLPGEVVPMAIIRPLSGSGAFAVMSDLTQSDPNSYAAYLSAVIMGSTETTFYVLAVYFGAAGITKIRYALLAALAADFTGMLAACIVSPIFF
ncbi:UNVERIFIED_CONTAM: hypothetical protein GTU68_020104 [Idotea baltica]|nr:hypothetical protein [Idotea baltica]